MSIALRPYLLAMMLTTFLALTSCCWRPSTEAYRAQYAHLKADFSRTMRMQETEYFIIFLVNARHLDYADTHSFLGTVAKHPDDASKEGDVGHAWIYLQGIVDGKRVILEGGHSGELGIVQAKYFDGIMNYIDFGYSNPTGEQMRNRRYEPNPIKYLWATQRDGFFQRGSGRHVPTFAAKFTLTQEQFQRIFTFVKPRNYCYREYALSRNQCASFVTRVAACADIVLACEMTMAIKPVIKIGAGILRLWQDPRYGTLTFSSPDLLEQSLMRAVREGRAEYALPWYTQRSQINH